MQSPLRYPGGKSNFVATVEKIVRSSNLVGLPLYEPYAGSAAVSLGLLATGSVCQATILEKDPLLYAFWRCVFERTDDLISQFQDLPITIETWHRLHPLLNVTDPNDTDLLQLGLAGLFLNRANFSGILNGGPIGGKEQKSQYKIDCRTNKTDIVKRLSAIATLADKVVVEYGDAVELITRNKMQDKALFYIDPPYFNKGALLYRHHYKFGDHKRLAEALRDAAFPWVLSYDSHHVIEFFYEDFYIRKHKFQYSARSPKKDEELLISNFKIIENLDDWESLKQADSVQPINNYAVAESIGLPPG